MAQTTNITTVNLEEETILLDFLDCSSHFLIDFEIGQGERSGFLGTRSVFPQGHFDKVLLVVDRKYSTSDELIVFELRLPVFDKLLHQLLKIQGRE